MAVRRVVSAASLGLCEHCNALLTMEDLPSGAMDAKWLCPSTSCGKVLTHLSFGYEQIQGRWRKTRWVGPDGKWTYDKESIPGSFDLGSFHVVFAAIASAN